jgi:hypothetical protein
VNPLDALQGAVTQHRLESGIRSLQFPVVHARIDFRVRLVIPHKQRGALRICAGRRIEGARNGDIPGRRGELQQGEVIGLIVMALDHVGQGPSGDVNRRVLVVVLDVEHALEIGAEEDVVVRFFRH